MTVFVRRFFIVCMTSCCFLSINAQKNKDSIKEAFLDRQLYIIFGASFSSHPGMELSCAYFHDNNWMFILRSWEYGYDSPKYPAPGPGRYGREWPYDYFELSLQGGRWVALPHNFFAFASTGLGYVNNHYPIRRDSTDIGYGLWSYKNVLTHDRAIGWMTSAGLGWRKWGWSLMVVPGIGVSKVKTSKNVSLVLAITARVGKKFTGY